MFYISISGENHYDHLFLLPPLSLQFGTCGSSECSAQHFVISAGWLFWHASLCFEWESE